MVTISLGPALPRDSSSQPGDGPGTHGPPIRPCSKWGLAATVSPRIAGRSYHPFSPLPRWPRRPHGRYCLCATFRLPGDSLYHRRAWALPSTLPGGARTFLSPRTYGGSGHPACPTPSTLAYQAWRVKLGCHVAATSHTHPTCDLPDPTCGNAHHPSGPGSAEWCIRTGTPGP